MTKPHKSKWNDNVIIEQLNNIIATIGKFPTSKDLSKINRNDIVGAIQQHGSFNRFRKLMGYNIERHTNNYWSKEVTTYELKEKVKMLGHFPTQNELCRLNEYSLLGAMSKYGGLCVFKKELGYGNAFEKGYWNDETIIEHLKNIVSDKGGFPSNKELKTTYKTLYSTISRHGGIKKFREIMGYTINDVNRIYLPKRCHNIWNNEIIIEEIKEIIADINDFPTQKYLRTNHKNKLLYAININGGINKFRLTMGYKPLHHN